MTSVSAGRDLGEGAVPATSIGPDRTGAPALSHLHACLALVLLALACYLPGFVSLQPMDRDEPRFAQASKQMLETGDLVDIRFQDEARHKKPVGIYWLQSAVVGLAETAGVPRARTTIALYRLPSLLGAIATVLLTYWAALPFLTRHHAVFAAALIAASIVLGGEARLAKTDAVLAACAVAAMGALARVWLGRRAAAPPWSTTLVFWLALAAGILIKGPLVPMFAGLAAAALSVKERSARWLLALRPSTGVPLTILLVAPWFVAITVRSAGGFFAEAVGHDMLGKVGTAQTQHWAPPGTYLLAFFGTFWPGAALAALAIPFAWRNRGDDEVAFALAWILPSWLVFEAVPTKLPHYVLPLYPAVAILTVLAIARGALTSDRRGAGLVAGLIPFVPLAMGIGLAAGASALGDPVPWAGLALVAVSGAFAVAAWRRFVGGDPERTVVWAVTASVALSAGVLGLAQPVLASLKISPRLAELVRTAPCPSPAVGTLGYREPSLVFLVGTDLAMLDGPQQAADFLARGGCRMLFVEGRARPGFEAAEAERGAVPAIVGRVSGFNINGGRRLDIAAYARSP